MLALPEELDPIFVEYISEICKEELGAKGGKGSYSIQFLDELGAVLGPALMSTFGEWDEEKTRTVTQRVVEEWTGSTAGPDGGSGGPQLLAAPVEGSAHASAMEVDPTLKWMENARDAVVELTSGRESHREARDRRRKEREARQASNRARLERMSKSWRKVYADLSDTRRSLDVRIDNIDVAVAGHPLIAESPLTLYHGRRYGLVGFNGSGKTTLLRNISDREIGVPAHLSILHVEQEVMGDDTPVLRSVLEVDVRRDELMKELELVTNSSADDAAERMSALYRALEEIDADKAESVAAHILSGLGFSHDMLQLPTSAFSGGWRMRLALARALYCKPDLLLLDEPTNMLDMPAVVWLERYLNAWDGTLLVVSHDRDFLNSVATDIIHLHHKRLHYYRGNYEAFDRVRVERLKQQDRERENRERFVSHVGAFIERFRYNSHRAALVQSRIKMLEKLEPVAALMEDPSLSFTWPNPTPLSAPILKFEDVAFGYGLDAEAARKTALSTGIASGGLLFRDVSFHLHMESRVAIVGANGTGKSTLLSLLTGDEEPSSGYVFRHARLRLAVFSQHHVDQLDLDKTSVEFLADKFPGNDPQYFRAVLGKYGIHGNTALQTLDTLSGGQKSRVVFAAMALAEPHMLIMDEPTNHLDIETVEALAAALNSFTGAYVLVTHDERLIRLVCDELWVVKHGTVSPFQGTFDAYKKMVAKEADSK